MAEGIRKELLQALGLSGPSGGAADYSKLIADESLRYSQPQLENSLIQRGLGGSSVYRDALTELINKAAVQGTLSSGDYVRNNLASLTGNYLLPYYQIGQNLLGLSAQTGLSEEQLAQQRYLATLPYLATVNTPGGNKWQNALMGGFQGMLNGGGFIPGAVTGFANSQSTSVPYATYQYDQLLNLMQKQQNQQSPLSTADISTLAKIAGAF
jgi:hypothetical protein